MLSVLLVVVFTGSRGAVIASLVVLSLYFIIYVKLNHLLLLYSLLGATVSLCVARFLDFHFLTEAILGLLAYVSWDSINHSDSIGLRQQLILNGFRSLKSTYGLGIGGGADLKMQQIYNNTYYGNHADNLILSMHNFWVELLVNGGAIFFLLFVVWYLMMIHKLHYISKHSYDNRLQYFASSSCLALIGFSLAAISASSVIYFFPMWLLFGFSIATINNYLRMEAK
ncbi:hypothetical protein GHYDROH2_01730 [Geobacter hydrogenophilus]|uniref:O-antigen ligase-related domain-containing protein n=1 Tax=Geobacter hydrogenophilus TaxID=40983 RepID=A0A9W6L9R0_9BACT|nr:hypothetical protein GHYDROH2_01730 [Geobacter hydrogenophilus]